jgi:hypothetical protein
LRERLNPDAPRAASTVPISLGFAVVAGQASRASGVAIPKLLYRRGRRDLLSLMAAG